MRKTIIQKTQSCPKLIEFALLEHDIGIIVDDIKCIFDYMRSSVILTLNVCNTPDPICSHSSSHHNDQQQLPIVDDESNLLVRSYLKSTEHMKYVIIPKNDELFEFKKQYCHTWQITTCL